MFTRCPACSTVHPVNATLLAQGGGRYRCGKCSATSNALESLFDEWPDAGQKPAPAGETPLLGQPLDLDEALKARLDPDDAGLTGEATEPGVKKSRVGRTLLRAAWLLGIVLVGAVIIIKAAEFSGHPVLEPEEIEDALVSVGIKQPAPEPVFRDLDLIHLVARELSGDPQQPGILRLEATIVNRASKSQPYPALEVILFDAEGTEVAAHDFEPSDYLPLNAGPDMSPHAYLPFSLELDDPGVQAVGFELNFH